MVFDRLLGGDFLFLISENGFDRVGAPKSEIKNGAAEPPTHSSTAATKKSQTPAIEHTHKHLRRDHTHAQAESRCC